MSALGLAGRSAMRWSIWGRILLIAELALTFKRHLDLLESGEKTELQQLVRKSKGRPSNLSARERARLRALVAKIEPQQLARATALAGPWRRKG